MSRRVLVVDDERDVRVALGQTLELADLEPVLAGSFIEAKDHIAADFDGVVLTDIRMPGRDGFHLLAHARSVDPDLPVILLTGEGDIPMAVQAMSDGAYGFLEKPCGAREVLPVIEAALRARRLVMENRQLKQALDQGDAAARMLFGVSAQAETLRTHVRRVARSAADVLVCGEPGSGTPKVAEVIHLLSGAVGRPFVKRPAAQMTVEGLVDAIVEAGAGTLYLDEITQLSLPLQFALLEALEDGVAARVISGSTRDIEAAVADGKFSTDLFYRLDLMRVRVPSLRERTEDIPVMFQHYVAQACEQANLDEPEISPEVISDLMARDWPGNARALMNAAMRFALGVEDIGSGAADQLGLVEQLARVERSLLVEALQKTQGRAGDAAKALKLPRKTFYDKLARYDIRPETYRAS